MLFSTYKDQVRQDIKLWLDSENDGEALDEAKLDKVAKYLYANEYPLPDAQETVLYDFLRLTS